MPGRHFLASYRPLIHTKAGRAAVAAFGLPPFVDASCRREPDLTSAFPSISALCRRGKFAPRLSVGDRVAYISVKGRYGRKVGWALLGLLEVRERFESHFAAAEWYRNQALSLPSNCMVPGNNPEPFERTSGMMPERAADALNRSGDRAKAVQVWDATYKVRIKEHSTFLVCDPLYVELQSPKILTEEDMVRIFRRVPGTRTPPVIRPDEFSLLLRTARGTDQ